MTDSSEWGGRPKRIGWKGTLRATPTGVSRQWGATLPPPAGWCIAAW